MLKLGKEMDKCRVFNFCGKLSLEQNFPSKIEFRFAKQIVLKLNFSL